jgi:hypothetical protein
MEIPTLARAVNAQFRTSLNSEDGTGGVGKSEAPIRAMNSGNAEGAKRRRFEIADKGNMTRHRAATSAPPKPMALAIEDAKASNSVAKRQRRAGVVELALDCVADAVGVFEPHISLRRMRSSARQARKQSAKHTRIIVTRYGGPDVLQVLEEERPEPKDGEVRVRVLAAGVSLPDIMAREGVHPETPPVPYTPGWDLVGEVDRLGNGVAGIELGQIVAAMPIHGAYAEFVCLLQRELIPVPSGLDAAEVVSLVLNYVTAYQMLHRSAKVKPASAC